MRPWLTLPTLVTLARLALAPLIIYEIVEARHMTAAALFAVAAATDIVDGYLARRFDAATKTGAFLDPIADKVLLSGVYLALALNRSVPWWFVGVIFGRDVLILASSSVALMVTRLRAFPPSVWGKASTFLQIITAVTFLARNATGSALLDTLAGALIWPTAALTIWSGIHYGWRGVHLVRID